MPALPVIMLTAKGDPVDRVIGLELGADDYVPKPFDPRELIARVRTVLRRTQAGQPSTRLQMQHRPLLRFGKLVLDTSARTLTADPVEVPLTNIEFRLLLELVKHPGDALSRESLTRAAQVGNYRPLDRAVDVQIARLRRKLRQADDRCQVDRHRARRGLCMDTAGRRSGQQRMTPRIKFGMKLLPLPMFGRIFIALIAMTIAAAAMIAATFSEYQERVTAMTLAPMWAAAIKSAQEQPG